MSVDDVLDELTQEAIDSPELQELAKTNRDVTITQKEACDMAHDVMTDAERGLAEERIEEACFCCKQCCEPDSVEITMGPADEPRYPYKPDYAEPPGATIQECMSEKGWNRIDLRSAIGLPEGHVGLLFGGDLAITLKIACRLAKIFGPSAPFWLALEANYRVTLARLAREKAEV